ncbi:MAG: ABC transporter substrate-binding protein [Chloroflexi bacterium]|nr:ABC transporter substrate-binding protein [Chloroflexota bacterium]
MTHFLLAFRLFSAAVVAALVVAACAPASPAVVPTPITAPAPSPAAAPTAAPALAATPPPVQALPRVETPTPSPAQPRPVTPTPAPAAPDQPRYGGVLTAYQGADPVTLDPSQEGSIFTHQNSAGVFSTLMQVDPQQLPDRVLIGDLAEKWSVSKDAAQWTFVIHAGVVFHDGKPLTSTDVAFTFERMQRPPDNIKSPYKELLLAVSKVETPDVRTVRISLSRPVTYFAALMAQPTTAITPKHILEKDQHALEQQPVGSGPFKFKAWNKSVSIELARNPNYFKKGQPYLDGTRWVILREPATQLAALRIGRVVFSGHGTRGLSKREADLLEKDIPGVNISRYTTTSVQHLVANIKRKPLDDIRVRKAVFNALSQPDVISTAYQGAGFKGAYMGPGEWALPESELNKMPPYRGPTQADMDEAKRLLTDAGYPRGLTLEMLQPHLYEPMTLVVAAGLRKVGIEAKIRVMTYPVEWLPAARQGNFQLTIGPTTAALYDPDAYLKNSLAGDSQNYANIADPETEALYQKQGTIVDFAERKKVVDQLQLKIWEQRSYFPTFHVMYFHAALPVVRGWTHPGVILDNFKYEGIWLAQ